MDFFRGSEQLSVFFLISLVSGCGLWGFFVYLRPLGTTGRNINSSQTRSAVLQQALKSGSPEIREKKKWLA